MVQEYFQNSVQLLANELKRYITIRAESPPLKKLCLKRKGGVLLDSIV